MPETFAEVEERVTQAIAALDTRENVSRNKIAREFRVPITTQRASTGIHGSGPHYYTTSSQNAHDPELLMEYFETYKSVVDELGILPEDQWNFDETGYRIGTSREDCNFSRCFTKNLLKVPGQSRVSHRDGVYQWCWRGYSAHADFDWAPATGVFHRRYKVLDVSGEGEDDGFQE